MKAATIPPSSRPPKPGGGAVGNTGTPSATRRVGAMGREWNTSNSARITSARYLSTGSAEPSRPPSRLHVLAQGLAHHPGRFDHIVELRLRTVGQQVAQRSGLGLDVAPHRR